ncbi:MAG: polysaccharide deacetylase family protein [Lachnospiraceae bacterium]
MKLKWTLLTISCILFVVAVIGIPAAVLTSVNQSTKKLPIYCVDTDKPQIALSFDAAWGNEDTQEILDILEKHQVKVTFFMTGGWVESFPEDVKKIAEAGHDLGNHSANHKHMSELSAQECKEELMSVHQRVKELTGVDMCLFRPPYGDYNDTLITTANENGYHVIQWDVDSLDWKNYGVDSIVQTVTGHSHLGNGSIILMHNGADYTADALDSVITTLQSQGYELVPISKLIYKQSYFMDHEGRQYIQQESAQPEQSEEVQISAGPKESDEPEMDEE